MARKLIKQVEVQKRHNMIFNIPKSISAEFMEECLLLSDFIRIDELDCAKSWMRQPSQLSLEDATNLILRASESYFTFVLRNGYHSQFGGADARYWEYCLSGMKKTEDLNDVEIFVWIEIKEEDGNKLVEKYKLKKNDE
jgi:hypothetical protein